MAHPSQILKDSAPHKIVIVDSNTTADFEGNFFAYTCLVAGSTSASVKGRNIFERTGAKTYTETAETSTVLMTDVVGVTIFGDFTSFIPADNDARYILYVSVEDQ